MEQEIARRLPEYLFERGIEYHARRKFRNWCDCSYCLRRRQLTADITHGCRRTLPVTPGYRRQLNLPGSACICTDGCPGRYCIVEEERREGSFWYPRLPPSDNLEDAIRNRNERLREQLRKQLRSELKALRNSHKEQQHVEPRTEHYAYDARVGSSDRCAHGRSSDGGRYLDPGREEARIDGIHYRGVDSPD